MKKLMFIAFLFAITESYASVGKEMAYHLVQPHENLFRISLIYNSTVEDIVGANPGLTADKVRSGAVIKVPKGTKMRDAAFVAALMHGKKPPVSNPDQATDLAQAQKIQDGLGGNLFIVAKKPIEQMEKEAALENNVAQRSFKATIGETAQAVQIPQQIPRALNNTKQPTAALSVYDQFAALQAEDAAPVASAATAQTAQPVAEMMPECEMHPPMIEASETITTVEENKADINVIDVSDAGISAGDTRNTDLLNQLQQLIAANQVIAINISVVLKDGSVRMLNAPDDQHKALSQLGGETAVR
jgi:hypothetical protein